MKISLPKILITGGAGQLAQALKKYAPSGWEMIFMTRRECDITNKDAIARVIKKYLPDVVVNTAAYTAVDQAEIEKFAADSVNRLGAEYIAQSCHQQNIPLIHISTDYVFNGIVKKPYTENEETYPLNYYGLTKYAGEQSIRKYCEQHIILRVSGVFSHFGQNFFKTICKLAQEKTELNIVHNQISCPTYAGDIANSIFTIAKKLTHFGTYHFCSDAPISWYQFASMIVEQINKQKRRVTRIQPISAEEFASRALRPAYSVLNCDKIMEHYGVIPSSLNNVIPKLLADMQLR